MLCVWILAFYFGGSFALESIQIAEGVKLVELSTNEVEPRADGSLVSNFHRFLSTHELEIKLDELLPGREDIQRGLTRALGYLNIWNTEDDETGRKGGGGLGGKKGGGAVLAMAAMMGGTMAALGFGAVGMLAMKALTVSAMALVLSAVVGLKKLLSKGDDDGGHSVSYIPVHHGGGGGGGHRRRRSLPYYLAYGAYRPKTPI